MLPMGKARQDRPVEYHGLIMPCCQVSSGKVVYAWGGTDGEGVTGRRSLNQSNQSVNKTNQSIKFGSCVPLRV